MKRLAAVATVLVFSGCLPPDWGASAVLHPARRPLWRTPPIPYEDVVFSNGDVELRGWLFCRGARRRGLIVYLHGVADNRESGIGLAQRFCPQGYDVLVYDSRAHGRSGGKFCTYGFHERQDLSKALDALGGPEAILFGSSMGAAVALQAAAVDPRIRGVIAQSAFSDLATVVREQAPWFATSGEVARALAIAEGRAGFRVEEVSPERLGPRVRAPVLLLHGDQDRKIRPSHAHRVYEALAGPKRLVVIPGAGHDDVLAHARAWQAVEEWLAALPAEKADKTETGQAHPTVLE